jgi:hypothetical protein
MMMWMGAIDASHGTELGREIPGLPLVARNAGVLLQAGCRLGIVIEGLDNFDDCRISDAP